MLNKSIYLFALPFAVLTHGAVSAQEIKKEKKEIIIHEGTDSTKKMVIVVNGDKVMVNGKEVTGDEKSNFIIKKSKSSDGKKVNVEVTTTDTVNSKTFITIDGKTIITDGNEAPSNKPKNIKIHRKIFKDGKVIEDSEGSDELMGDGLSKEFEMIFDNKMGETFSSKPGAQLGVLTGPNDKGAEIKEVKEGTVAQKAGLLEGDIITSVNGQKIDGPEQLVSVIKSKKPGDEVSIGYLRAEKAASMKIKLGEGPSVSIAKAFGLPLENGDPRIFDRMIPQEGFPRTFNFQNPKAPRPKLGLEIQDTEDGKGVKVLNVLPELPASKSGLKKDDVIISINDEKMSDVDVARKSLREVNGSAKLKVRRGSQMLDIELKLPKPLKKASL